ncbi:hypothetical protein W02_17910 [Nitrospira sp. KM1]|nr:hypothetical protein W02_17910 [Nitrospira sp. KM1]
MSLTCPKLVCDTGIFNKLSDWDLRQSGRSLVGQICEMPTNKGLYSLNHIHAGQFRDNPQPDLLQREKLLTEIQEISLTCPIPISAG